jgi:hypothetical protein
MSDDLIRTENFCSRLRRKHPLRLHKKEDLEKKRASSAKKDPKMLRPLGRDPTTQDPPLPFARDSAKPWYCESVEDLFAVFVIGLACLFFAALFRWLQGAIL